MSDKVKGHRRVAEKYKKLGLRAEGFQRDFYLLMAAWHEDQATDWARGLE
jgi:hypothetical protein